MSRRSTAIAIAAVVTVGVAGGAYLAHRGVQAQQIGFARARRDEYEPSDLIPLELPEIAAVRSGLAVEDNRIVITSYDEWVRFAPDAIEDALVDGAIGAEGVLVDVMRRALPRFRWPPDPGSALEGQWPQMVAVVAEKLRLGTDPDPNTGSTRKLRLL